jgi:hypothetical protein
MLATIIIMGLVGDTSKGIQTWAYDKKIKRLAAGMEERDLIRIMGNPVSKVILRREEIAWLPEDPKSEQKTFIIYTYSLGSFFSHDLLRNSDIISTETKVLSGFVQGLKCEYLVRAQKLLLLILLIEPVLCWLCVRWWCRRRSLLPVFKFGKTSI